MKFYRDNNERKSREVVKIWEDAISHNIDGLGKESTFNVIFIFMFIAICIISECNVLEQIAIAAIDCHRLNVAEKCIHELYKEFPVSCRVRILESMYHEAEENYNRALQILNDVIKQDSTNSSAKKRKIAICKTLGKTTEAIKELTEYLKM